jgi:NADH-quinone oxidoreductase subunit K
VSVDAGTILRLLSAWLFAVGAAGVLLRRSPLSVFMAIELMLNAANLQFVLALGRPGLEAAAANGLTAALIVIAVAAAEVAVGLAVMVLVFQRERAVELEAASRMRG